MSSKQVTDRQKNAASVLAALQAQVASAATEIEKALTPYLQQGEAVPDVALLATLSARRLEHLATEMVSADEAHEAELGDDETPRRERDEAVAKLYDHIAETREWLRGFYGQGALRGLGFSDKTPEDPVQLARFAGQIIDALQRPLPAPRQKGATWDPAETISTLGAERDDLTKHVADVARETREAQVTWARRTTAMDDFDSGYQRSVDLVDGLLRFGGQDALADRLRPPTRKHHAPQEEETPPPAPATLAAAAPTPPDRPPPP